MPRIATTVRSQARETADRHSPAGYEGEGDETVSDAVGRDDGCMREEQAADAVGRSKSSLERGAWKRSARSYPDGRVDEAVKLVGET